MAEKRPIVVRRTIRRPNHAQHHNSAWKVAYADFVTAMMAFFLMLWLISSVPQQTLDGLAEYFNDAQFNIMPPGAVLSFTEGPTTISDIMAEDSKAASASELEKTVDTAVEADPQAWLDTLEALKRLQAEQEAESEERRALELARFAEARADILDELEGSIELEQLKRHLIIEPTPEGLRIQILDRDETAMFPLGSDVMYPHTRRLLSIVAKAVSGLPNKLSIRGHTDALPYAEGAAYDNWRLSTDRANATRVALEGEGIEASRVDAVVGKADAEHLLPDAPLDPRNRRISIVLLYQKGKPATAEAES
jgi:chemotaxis protein MotB